MNKLFLLSEEIYTSGYMPEVLTIISTFVVLCGVLVIISKNPIISVLFLIGLFSGIASYLIIAGLSFIGLSYIIVYVGAVSILFLFILMLIDIRISELANDTNNSIPLSIMIAIFLNYILFKILPYDLAFLNNNNNYINYLLFGNRLNASSYLSSNYEVIGNTYGDIGFNNILFISSKIWDGNMATESNHISSIGNIMYTNYNV
jgi:NADH-ubiquinone oxidoreductase chain 6